MFKSCCWYCLQRILQTFPDQNSSISGTVTEIVKAQIPPLALVQEHTQSSNKSHPLSGGMCITNLAKMCTQQLTTPQCIQSYTIHLHTRHGNSPHPTPLKTPTPELRAYISPTATKTTSQSPSGACPNSSPRDHPRYTDPRQTHTDKDNFSERSGDDTSGDGCGIAN